MRTRLALLIGVAIAAVMGAVLQRALALYIGSHDPVAVLVSGGRVPGSSAVVASVLLLVATRAILLFVLPPIAVLLGTSVLRRLPPRRGPARTTITTTL